MQDLEQVKSLMLSLLRQAGLYLENKFYSFKNIYDKEASYITDNFALKAEEIIVTGIKNKFPEHQIATPRNHQPELLTSKEPVWLVKAVDGLSHFSRNIPIYTINLTFQVNGQVMLGGVNFQPAKQIFLAEAGQGATLNGLPIHVSSVKELSQAYLFVELPEEKDEHFGGEFDKIKELARAAKQVETFRIGALGQCLVAIGAFDAYIDFSGTSTIYNQAASLLMVKEAGGEVVHLEPPQKENIRILATNGQLTKEILEILNNH